MGFFDAVFFDVTDGGSSEKNEDKSTATRVVGVVLYMLLFIATIANYLYKRLKLKLKIPAMAKTFYICLPTFMLLRAIWLIIEIVLETKHDSDLDLFNSVLNRICMCVFLFVFISLLFYWIDTIHTTVNASFAKKAFAGSMEFGFLTPCGRIIFYISTGVVIALVLILMLVRVALKSELHSDDDDYSDKKQVLEDIREANNMIISVMFLILGGCFLFYGTKLNCRIGKNSGSSITDLWKIEAFSIGLCVCFFLRFFFFSFTIFGGKRIEEDVFLVFTYYIPEIVPALLILWSVNTKMFNDTKVETTEDAESFVDPLLAEEAEDESHL